MKQLKKTILTLALLLTAVGGAWADETLLLTIESKNYTSFKSGSQTFDDKVTITFSEEVTNSGNSAGWYAMAPGSLLTVAGTNGYTITSCKFYTNSGDATTGYTVKGESPSVYLYQSQVYTNDSQPVTIGYSGITKIEVYIAAPAPSGPEVAWDKAKKTGSFTMPGGNVTLEPDYYPQAALDAAPTAVNDVPATTDGAILSAGTVATIGETTTAQGTVMYYVSQTALDDAALLALAADQWTADVPTAADLNEGQAYVYYYVRGNDSDTDAETFSDGDILSANALTVTIAAEPTYAVTFADDTAEPTLWKAQPADGVKKGTDVTVTYSGTRKVIGVKAEKKAASLIVNPEVGQVIGSDGKNYAYASLPTGVTPVAMICLVSGSNGLALALTDIGYRTWDNSGTSNEGKTAAELCSAWNTSKAVTGGTWKLATKDEWDAMISTAGSYTALRDGFSSVDGTNMVSGDYWSSTEADSIRAWDYRFGGGIWYDGMKTNEKVVRPCLEF